MMSEQIRKTQSTARSEGAVDSRSGGNLEKKGKRIGEELDRLLDELDGVLEENAEEFVASYVQQGGQ
jgi:ubiquitin-like protein Pup